MENQKLHPTDGTPIKDIAQLSHTDNDGTLKAPSDTDSLKEVIHELTPEETPLKTESFVEHELTARDIENNPDLAAAGLKEGDEIMVPVTDPGNFNNTPSEDLGPEI